MPPSFCVIPNDANKSGCASNKFASGHCEARRDDASPVYALAAKNWPAS